jgi:hypothetical protein
VWKCVTSDYVIVMTGCTLSCVIFDNLTELKMLMLFLRVLMPCRLVDRY